MPLREIPPEREDRRPCVHFKHRPPECGKNYPAFIAGRCHWFDCHWEKLGKDGRSKPCLYEITDGALKCPFCYKWGPPELQGYQPLYREFDSLPSFCIVKKHSRAQIDGLEFHDRVLVGRGYSKDDGVYVIRASSQTPKFVTIDPAKNKPADLTDTLLKLWKVEALVAWYNLTHKKSDTEVSPEKPKPEPGPRKRGNKKPFSPMLQAAAAVVGIPPDEGAMADDFNNALVRAKERALENEQRNGKS